jgi:hypothetical protein
VDGLWQVTQHRRRVLNSFAREGGERLKQGAKTSLVQALGAEAIKPLARLLSLKHEFPMEWHQSTPPAAPAVGTFTIDKERFPYLFHGKSKTHTVRKVHIYAVLKHGAEPALPLSVVLTPPGGDENRAVSPRGATDDTWVR